MTEIIQKGREHCVYPITITNISKEVLTFTCSACGCVFRSDNYGIAQERCPNGDAWYWVRCPWCGNRRTQK